MAIIANCGNGHLAVPFHPVTSAKGDGLHLMLMAMGPLTSDARDASGNNRHGTAQAVEFAATGAAFNGRSSRIDVADAPQLATDDFSISLWVHTEAQLDDAVGDLISQYDSATRTGLNLSIEHHNGGKWTDLGAPWKSNGVTAMASDNGHLYVGVSRVLLHYSGLKPTIAHHIGGKVFRDEGGQWVEAEFVKKTAMMR